MSQLIGSFLEKAERKADELFLSDCGTSNLTFSETVIVSGRVYRYLKEKGIGREDFVMILLPRGVQAFAAMIGAWRAGAAFVALEEGYPEERVKYIKKDCGCRLTIDLEKWQQIQQLDPLSGYETVSDHDAAFAVYTSGSTGNPKGVLHEYGNLDLIAGSQIVEIHRFGLVAPTNFVASVIALITAMDRVFAFFIIPYSIVKNPTLLIQSFNENAITDTFCAPSVYRLFAQISSLKNIIVSSEPAFGIWSEDPGRRIYNFYVSSETGYIAAVAVLDRPNESAPIGKPPVDIRFILRDEEGRDVSETGEGEICVQAPYVRGYINLPEQTSRVFVNGEFHTGDLARRTKSGDHVILGRVDDMIKINGNRVEPGEIENAARRLLGLKEVIAKGFVEGKDAFICLYYTDEKCPDEEDARHSLMKALPYYMIPTHFIKLDVLPRTQSGKISRRLLPKADIGVKEGTYIVPKGEEEALCSAMAKVLSLPRVGAEDDFYTLGGNSISAMELVSICDLPSLNATQIFRGRTPRKIAAL
ncbi:MAG: non-ribosomal peptide synthetase [Lachnospiraceae bacterium]|nr:non-ribosomal peptide synthetase [Lachnospiraceae bacterium]